MLYPNTTCRVTLQRQLKDQFDLPDNAADMLCAFSVFTHMEHEDTYRYLVNARRVIKPGGRLVFSCLPMSLPDAQQLFALEAGNGEFLR